MYNVATPAYFESDGIDFQSPSLEIVDLMNRVLSAKEFNKWFREFYKQKSIDNIIKLPVVSDRSNYQKVHLDGLTLSRAWCMKELARILLEKTRQSSFLKIPYALLSSRLFRMPLVVTMVANTYLPALPFMP